MSWLTELRDKVQLKAKSSGVTDKLNSAGKSWKEFWDKPVTILYAYSPHEVVGNGGKPHEVTERRGDAVKQAVGAASVPAVIAGAATVGIPATVGGLVVGTAADAGGRYLGKEVVDFIGGDENALELAGDILGTAAGLYGGAKGANNTFTYTINDVARNNIYSPQNFKFLLDKRFYTDLLNGGVKQARLSGNYPLTSSERRTWVTGFKDDINKGIRFTRDEALNNPNLIKTTKDNADAIISLCKTPVDRMSASEFAEALDLLLELRDNNVPIENIAYLGRAELTAKFGTRRAINSYNEGDLYPGELNYQAFAKGDNTYYPFRTDRNTLHTHRYMTTPELRTHVGAHEYEHVVLKMHEIPLVKYAPKKPGEYGYYANDDLNWILKMETDDMINQAGTAGKWEGSLAEMDSELKGWRAQYNYPKFTEMTPEQQQHIIKLANNRFNVNPRIVVPKTSSINGKYNINFNNSGFRPHTLQEQPFYNVFTDLETAGYQKGGTLNYLNYIK